MTSWILGRLGGRVSYFAQIFYIVHRHPFFPGGSVGNKSACIAGDPGSTPGLGRSPGGGHGNPLQYSCLENPHGQGNLAGYSPWSHKESDTAEQLILSFMLFFFSKSQSHCFWAWPLRCVQGLVSKYIGLTGRPVGKDGGSVSFTLLESLPLRESLCTDPILSLHQPRKGCCLGPTWLSPDAAC